MLIADLSEITLNGDGPIQLDVGLGGFEDDLYSFRTNEVPVSTSRWPFSARS